jgi:tetratricopeptide (TPR) repeat protein
LRAVVIALLCLEPFAGAEAEERAVAARIAPGVGIAPLGAGARLRAGIAALEAGDAEGAAGLFAAVVDDHPVVADHAYRLWLKALLELSHYATAAHLASRFELEYPDSPLRGEVFRLLGDARHGLAAPAAARAAWQRARREVRGDEARATLDLSIAGSFERSGRDREASQAYLAVWTEAPTSEAAKTAEAALERLEKRSGRSLRTPPQLAKRARALYAARANQEALESFEGAIDGNLPARTRRELKRERSFTLFRLRRYPEAVVAFTELGDGRQDRFWRARSLARSSRVAESIREFEKLSKGRFDALAARSLLLAGILREDEADCTSALASFVRVASKAPTRGLRSAARWRLAWCAYRDERYREAVEYFETLVKTTPDPLERLGARYWRARSLQKLGAPEAADEFRALATEYPLSYYGWRAADRVDEGSLLREVPRR